MGNELEAKEFYLKWYNKFKNHKLDDTNQSILDAYNNTMDEIRLNEGEDEKLIDLQNQLENDPENCEIMFALANHLIEKEKYDLAIDFLVDIIAIDRNLINSAPHKVLLGVFSKLGTNNELVKEGRKKLTRVLF
jgi:thioredoxin-like negative regulator of GroEL